MNIKEMCRRDFALSAHLRFGAYKRMQTNFCINSKPLSTTLYRQRSEIAHTRT